MLLAFLMMTAMLPASADDVVKTNITSYTAPTAVSDFEESLEPQPVVNAGTAEGGTMFYRLGLDGTWSDTVPTATTAATYTVYWYVKGDETHNDLGSESAPMGSATVQQGHNDKVKFNVKSSGFNINLFYAKDEATAGSWIQTTFGDRGYSTVVKVGENAQKDLSSFAFGKALYHRRR